MKKELKTHGEVVALVDSLENKDLVIDAVKMPDGTYVVQWMPVKHYISLDGKKYPDEVWITKDNEMLNVQDIELEHLRNILRMTIRKNRETLEMFYQLKEAILSGDGESWSSEDPEHSWGNQDANPTLH